MEAPHSHESSGWPIHAILGYGTFGSKTPAGRRYHVRTGIALATLAILWPLSFFLWMEDVHPAIFWGVVSALAPGLVFGYIAQEMRRYWLELDELARRLQLEAAAWTYLAGMTAGTLLGGISFVFFNHAWIWFWCNPLWVVLLEPVRSTILYFITRRY